MKNKEFWDYTGKLLLLVALVIGFVSLSMNIISLYFEKKNPYQPNVYQAPVEENQVINVLGAGDVVYGNKAIEEQSYQRTLENLYSMVSNYDMSVYNQVSMLGNDVPIAFGESMEGLGIKAVSLANPDSLKYGKEGIDTSLAFFENSKLYTAGTYGSTDQKNLLRHFEVNGISIIMLSYTDYLNNPLPEHEQYLVNVYDDVRTPEVVAEAASLVDFVIVSISWQGEDGALPNDRQKEIAKALADAGASMIVGHAENAIQPVNWIDDTLIFYSLGNFVSDNPELEDRIGVVGGVTVTKSTLYDKKKIELTNPRVDLVYSMPSGGRFIAKPLSWFNETELPEKEELYQKYKQLLQSMDDSIRVGGIQ